MTVRTPQQDRRLADLYLLRAKRKRKKRRKRRTPRTSSRSLCARARLRQRQWHVSGSPGDVLLRAVFPSVVVRPEMPCIMAGMDLKDRFSGMIKAGIDGYVAPRAVFLSLVCRPRMLSILAGMDQKDSCRELFLRLLVSGSHLCGVFTTRQSLVPSSPLEYKSMDFSGRRLLVCFPYSVLIGLKVDTCMASVCEAFWLPHCRKLRILRSCSLSRVVDIHVFTQMLFPKVLIVQKTIKIPSCSSTRWPMSLSCWFYRFSRAGCGWDRSSSHSCSLRKSRRPPRSSTSQS